MGGLIKTNVFNPVDWGIFYLFYKAGIINYIHKTNINVNAGESNPKAIYYMASAHLSTGDSTQFECGVIRLGYNGNHATKYKDTKSTYDLLNISVSSDGFLQISSSITIRTFVTLYV